MATFYDTVSKKNLEYTPLNSSPVIPVDTITNPTPAITVPTPPATVPDTSTDLFNKYITNQPTPVDTSAIYAQANQAAGVQDKQQVVNDLSAQVNKINADAQAAQQTLESQSAGKDVTSAFLGKQQQEIARQAAIKALPLSAELAAAQGNLKAAQDNVNTLYKLKSDDATNQYNYRTQLLKSVYDFASAQEKAKLDKLQKEADNKFALEKDKLNFEQQKELAKYNAQLEAQDPYKVAQTKKLQAELNAIGSNANASDLLAYAQDTVSSGKLPSVQELKNANLTVGQVLEQAKSLPKADGEIVDMNTGIKSGKLSPAQVEGLAALRDLTLKIDQAKEKFKQLNTGLIGGTLGNIFPSKARQDYNIIKSEIVDLLSRARSGAALTESEIKTYSDKLPSTFNQTFWLGGGGENLLDGLKKSLSDKLDTSLKAQGTSMYGFSKVNLGGQDYTVGQEIEVNGVRGRINPDGTITTI